MRRRARLVAAAILVDAALGEPPERLHPVVWMGRTIDLFEGATSGLKDRRARLLAGLLVAVSLPLAAAVASGLLLRPLPARPRDAAEVALISTCLSMRGLARASGAVERELRRGDLAAARARAGEMVGRDTAGLEPPDLARAVVESVAENTSDGVVAPALYALVLGAPGALAYKAVNTLDSMIGHRDPPYLELGRASARADDLANFVPARLTALAAAVVSGRPRRVMATVRRYAPLTSSPNAGYPESAFAGALGLRLGGTNTYRGVTRPGHHLGEGRGASPGDGARAVALMHRLCALLLLASLALGETA